VVHSHGDARATTSGAPAATAATVVHSAHKGHNHTADDNALQTIGARPATKKIDQIKGQADFGNDTTADLRAMAARWKLNATRAAAIGSPELAGKMAVCISPYTPDVICKPDEPSKYFTGYMLELFEQVRDLVRADARVVHRRPPPPAATHIHTRT
jgi:hypothetical protein